MGSQMNKTKKCYSCGYVAVSEQNLKGQFLPFKDFDKVEIKHDIVLKRCKFCGELSVSMDDLKLLDDQLEYSISSDIRRFVKTIMSKTSLTQKEFASKVGLSEQYVSNLKKGVKFPSAQIFNFFKVLAEAESALEILGIPRTNEQVMNKGRVEGFYVRFGLPQEEIKHIEYQTEYSHTRRYMSVHDVKIVETSEEDDLLDFPQAV